MFQPIRLLFSRFRANLTSPPPLPGPSHNWENDSEALGQRGAQPRSPRPLPHTEPIDGDAVASVRPYVVASEQRQRRLDLLLALDGIDVGPFRIHGMEVV